MPYAHNPSATYSAHNHSYMYSSHTKLTAKPKSLNATIKTTRPPPPPKKKKKTAQPLAPRLDRPRSSKPSTQMLTLRVHVLI